MKTHLIIGLAIILSTTTGMYFGKTIGTTQNRFDVFEKYKSPIGSVLVNGVDFKDSGDLLMVLDRESDKNEFYACFLEIKNPHSLVGGLGALVIIRDLRNQKHGLIQLQIDEHDGIGMAQWHLSPEFIVNSEIQYQIYHNTDKVAFVRGRIGELGYWKKVDGKVRNFQFSHPDIPPNESLHRTAK